MNHQQINKNVQYLFSDSERLTKVIKIIAITSLLSVATPATAGGLFGKGGIFRGSVGNFLDGAIEKPILTPVAIFTVNAIGTIGAAHAAPSPDGCGFTCLDKEEKQETKPESENNVVESATTEEDEIQEFLVKERARLTIQDPPIKVDPFGNAFFGGLGAAVVKGGTAGVTTAVVTGATSAARSGAIGGTASAAKASIEKNNPKNKNTGRGGSKDQRYDPTSLL